MLWGLAVGKSTLFNALLQKASAEAANFPFCTIEPNTGIVSVPDSRMQVLADIAQSERVIPATMEFVDIAGQSILDRCTSSSIPRAVCDGPLFQAL